MIGVAYLTYKSASQLESYLEKDKPYARKRWKYPIYSS